MTFLRILLASFFLSLLTGLAFSSTTLNLEFGQANNVYNKARISGDDGTLFNLAPALDSSFYYRLNLIKKYKTSHGFRLLYAPLKFSGDKRYSQDIDFGGVNFPRGNKTEVEYQFNSYRGTYFYEFISKKNMFLRVGGTLKIRDAFIGLKQNDQKKFKKNTGIVPLLYLYSQYRWDNNLFLTIDFDGLMAPQGRAFDVALMLGYQLSPATSFHFGHRVLEGGADNKNVYNFSQINYYFTGLQIVF